MNCSHSFQSIPSPSLPWRFYTAQLMRKIENPYCAGQFTEKEVAAWQKENISLLEVREGFEEEGNFTILYALTDLENGSFIDVRFQTFGSSLWIGMMQILCEKIVNEKNVYADSSAFRKYFTEKYWESAEAEEFYTLLMMSQKIVALLMEKRREIVPHAASASFEEPLEENTLQKSREPFSRSAWERLSLEEKKQEISAALEREIIPYIILDGGGIEIREIIDDTIVVIAYQGACISCPSAVGGTLQAIQKTLQQQVYSHLKVSPENIALPPL